MFEGGADTLKDLEAFNIPVSRFEEELFLKYLKLKRGTFAPEH